MSKQIDTSIDNMQAGREMDALIAVKVKGYELEEDCRDFENCPFIKNADSTIEDSYFVPHYSTDIAAAWQVAEEIAFRIFQGDLQDNLSIQALTIKRLGSTELSGYAASFGFTEEFEDDWTDHANDFPNSSRAGTAPLAICRAALKALSHPTTRANCAPTRRKTPTRAAETG